MKIQRKLFLKRCLFDQKRKCPCHYCGKVLVFDEATLDHIIPQSLLGEWELKNLVIACVTCNNRRGDMPYEIFKSGAKPVKKEKIPFTDQNRFLDDTPENREILFQEQMPRAEAYKSYAIDDRPHSGFLVAHNGKVGWLTGPDAVCMPPTAFFVASFTASRLLQRVDRLKHELEFR